MYTNHLSAKYRSLMLKYTGRYCIFHTLRAILVKIPKTASTSVSTHMYVCDYDAGRHQLGYTIPPSPGGCYKHGTIMEIKNRCKGNQFSDYYKISFVRNPWDWFLSYYRHFKRSIGLPRYPNAHITIHQMFSKNPHDFPEFGEYIRRMEEAILAGVNDKRQDMHKHEVNPLMPQYKYLVDRDEKLLVDFVGKYENLQTDWHKICREFAIDSNMWNKGGSKLTIDDVLRLPLLNKSYDNNVTIDGSSDGALVKKHYRECYTDEEAEIIYNLYRKDIEMFNYEF